MPEVPEEVERAPEGREGEEELVAVCAHVADGDAGMSYWSRQAKEEGRVKKRAFR